MKEKIVSRQNEQMKIFIENISKTPIIQFACEKSGISRATYYRWCKRNSKFLKDVDTALSEGVDLMNDLAESKLLTAIKQGDRPSVFYWLSHRHKAYSPKLEISTNQEKQKVQNLTKEQEELIRNAISLAEPIREESDEEL